MLTPEEIIEMARQADVWVEEGFLFEDVLNAKTLAFAKLVAEKVEARYMQLFLDPENQPTQFGTATQEYREQEIKDEREACAKLVEPDAEHRRDASWGYLGGTEGVELLDNAAKKIRARGETTSRGEAQ